jgi:16S rRNA (cytosine1402-N4)-methyltransferase
LLVAANTTVLHQPVLLTETINALEIKGHGVYVDATFGRGGHTSAILAQLNAHGRLIVIDKDPLAISYAKTVFAADKRVTIYQDSFVNLMAILQHAAVWTKVQGIVFDLGVSSPQLADSARGFSFMLDGPLDMRMNPYSGQSVADWLAKASEAELAQVIYKYGEEKFARRIAKAIVARRLLKPLTTTQQLSELILRTIPGRMGRKHPATRTFMALRIFINQELVELPLALEQALASLAHTGRLAVISFHSLEDRIVKNFMRHNAGGWQWQQLPVNCPVAPKALPRRLKIIDRIRPQQAEIAFNPRARSAILRIAEQAS